METLLSKAFKKASLLPEEEKEAFAAFVIEELEQEERWSKLFKNSGRELTILANEALEEYKAGNTDELNFDKH